MFNFARLFSKRLAKTKVRRPWGSAQVVLPESNPGPVAPQFTLMAAAIIGNEAAYVPDWIEFHRLVGVERFLIYDNSDDQGIGAAVRDHGLDSIAEVMPWPRFVAGVDPQHLAYAHAICRARARTRWLALIDVDEFLFSPRFDTVKEALEEYRDLPAIAAFLVNFGTSGHETRPQGHIVESFTLRAADSFLGNRQNRSIVQPARIRSVSHPCRFETDVEGVCAYDERRQPIADRNYIENEPTAEIFRVNHYYSRSKEEFEEKLRTGWPRLSPGLAEKKRSFLAELEASVIEDRLLLVKFARLRSRI